MLLLFLTLIFCIVSYSFYKIFKRRKSNDCSQSRSSEEAIDDCSPSSSSDDQASSNAQSSSVPSSLSSPVQKRTYDVFLSFRGADTRMGITSHLYHALVDKGIHTFRDDERLKRGKPISAELLKAIDDSKIAIVVFSKNYANSSWCLEELATIVESKPKKIVIPVFYHVDPSDIRHQKNEVAEAMSKLRTKDEDKRKRWKDALTDAANNSGWDVPKIANGDESECIRLIVADVHDQLFRRFSSRSKDLVGIEWRVNKVLEMLMVGECDKVVMVGIWGIGGAGKTTTAKATFDVLSHSFEDRSCFLEIPNGECSDNELMKLQKNLLCKILNLKVEDIRISDVQHGINMMEQLLGSKKILIVLDNVYHREQLNALAPNHLFVPGSRVIITTRDNQLLNMVDDRWYKIELLDDSEAMQLFCRHAFRKTDPDQGFEVLCSEVVQYAKGLPLALKALGSHLQGLSLEEWKSEINVLRDISGEILSILKISYDRLDPSNKRIFLDVACFFRGWKINTVKRIHERGISLLQRKSLISVNKDDCIEIHDLVQEMGRNTVRTDHPGSRLWEREEILEVLSGNVEFEAAEGVVLQGYSQKRSPIFCNEALKRMKSIRVFAIQLYSGASFRYLDESPPAYLSKELQWLEWYKYPWNSLPETFQGKKLGALILQNSNIIESITREKNFEKLTLLNLSLSQGMRESPDFSDIPCLEELDLGWCEGLVEIHSSFGDHQKLKFVDLSGCTNLERLPDSLRMPSLICLNLSNCLKLENFPEIKQEMTALEELQLSHTGIRRIPDLSMAPSLKTLKLKSCKKLVEIHSSFGVHEKLESVDLIGCIQLERLSSCLEMKSLKYITLSNCAKLETFPELKGNMNALETIILSSTAIRRIPDLSMAPCLKTLDLAGCIKLVEIHSSVADHKNLQSMDLSYCIELKRLSGSLQMQSLKYLNLQNCEKLETFPEIQGNMTALEKLNLSETKIKGLPDSIRNLTGLRGFDLNGCTSLVESVLHPVQDSQMLNKAPTFVTAVREDEYDPFREICFTLPLSFPQLMSLDLTDCNLSSLAIPESCLPSLKNLVLCVNNMKELVISEDCISSLRFLDLRYNMWVDNSRERQVRQCLSNLNLENMMSLLHTCPSKFNTTSIDWEAITRITDKEESTTVLLSNITQIPKWFGYQIRGLKSEVILSPVSCRDIKGLRGLAIFLRTNLKSGDRCKISFRCSPKSMKAFEKEEYLIRSNEMLFHYVPIDSEWLKQCLSNSKATKICMFHAHITEWKLRVDLPTDAIEWGVRLVCEDEAHEINYNGITHGPSDNRVDDSSDTSMKDRYNFSKVAYLKVMFSADDVPDEVTFSK